MINSLCANAGDLREKRREDWEDPLEEGMETYSVFLPGESYGQWSLVGYSPCGRKELDTTERLHDVTTTM